MKMADRGSPPTRAAHAIGFGLALLTLSLVATLAFLALDYNWNWSSVYHYKQKFIEGWLFTLALSVATLLLSLLVGTAAALAKRSRILVLRYLAVLYIEIIRGTPLLVQIYFFFYVVADAAGLQNRYLVGIGIMSIFTGAYIAEIIRSGIESVGKSQLLSAKGIGFTPYQTYRYVIFPQALRRSLPALAGQFANLIKDSSLLSVIAINEFTLRAQEVNAFTYSAFESFFPLAVGYLALTLPLIYLARRLEKRMQFET